MKFNNPHVEACLSGHHSFFRGVVQKEREYLDKNHRLSHHKKGNLILKDGEKPLGLMCLASGKVKLFREGVSGREQILKLVRPQGFVGYRSVFADSNYSASAMAMEDSVICTFDKTAIFRVIRRNPDLAVRFIKLLAEELGFSNNRIVSLTQKHLAARVAESILVLRDTYGFENDGLTIDVIITREELANLSNMTTSNAIRTLSQMVSEGIVRLNGKKIMILDYMKLARISELG
jgi:CRP-like cAMP-binding protein